MPCFGGAFLCEVFMVMKPKGATHLAKTFFGWAYAKNKNGKWFVHVNNVWKEAFNQNLEVKPVLE